MKREIYISVIVASVLSISTFIIGCGSSGSKTKVDAAQEINKEAEPDSIHKEEVVRDDDKIEFDTNDVNYTNAFILDNHEGLKIAKTENYVYLTFTHNAIDAPNIQFFIDSDSNSKTGYQKEGGVEYKIENGQLHVADNNGTDVWHAYIEEEGEDSVKVNTILNKSDSIRLESKLFENSEFSVRAQALNNEWIAQIISPISLSKTFFTEKSIDDVNLSAIPNYSEDTNSSLELKIRDSENFITMYLLGDNFRDSTQFYIDVDNDFNSGKQGVSVEFGADYMIENGKLYQYDSTSSNWNWSNYQDIRTYLWKEDKKIIVLDIDKKSLDINLDRLKFAVEMNDVNNGVYDNTIYLPQREEIPKEYILNN